MFRHLLNAVKSLVNLPLALETERYRDYADGQYAHLLRLAGYHRSGTRTRSAAHSGGDERHLGAVAEHFPNVFDALLRGFTRLFGLVSGAKPLLAELQMHRHGRIVKRLIVRIAQHERHVVNALPIHVVHRIAASTANADYLYNTFFLLGFAEIDYATSLTHI